MEYECKTCSSAEDGMMVRLRDMETMRKHVAIKHCTDEYLTHRCVACNRAYYDMFHFLKHLELSTTCNQTSLKIEPLDPNRQKFFDALMAQWPVETIPLPAPTPTVSLTASTPKALSVCKEEESPMDVDGSRAVPVIDLGDDEEEEDRKNFNEIALMPPAKEQKNTVSHEPATKVPISKTPAKKPGPKPKGKRRSVRATTTGVSTVPSPAVRAARSTRARAAPIEDTTTEARSKEADVVSWTPGKPEKKVKQAPTTTEEILPDRTCKSSPKKYRIDSDSEDDSSGGEAEKENLGKSSKKLLDLCQLCVELENNRPPIHRLAEKEAHAMIHLKFAPTFANMPYAEARRRDEFKRCFAMCFEEGFYDVLKRQQQGGGDAAMEA